ncbi:DUF1214 domain-containing protein [Paeniglutamicibacter cryotolerans]|uniref:DUF1214 domain-containing protein n=1 Tax=Paeniglutamicibacter cryotolerans TaxID=670079 RepID=A0A839QVP9_9MICC|nr:DUF1214 domain-containing protein [Paeniglutamicibacter cryotolerans]MBB2996081.1 hypothetical protein [Paeniglutamicibacter cryotolerans]
MTNVLAWIAQSGVVQGVIIGAFCAFLTTIFILNAAARNITTTVNGWSSIPLCGKPENGILVRAACAKALPVVNVLEEAAYWVATVDGSGLKLNGKFEYVIHIPARQFPPHDAFWSLTPTDIVGYMVSGASPRPDVSDRSHLLGNADGSTDIYLQQSAPKEHEQNWLPIPAGTFKLMLRVYLPGPAILDGSYSPPPAVRAQQR